MPDGQISHLESKQRVPQNPTIDRSVVGPIVGVIAEITGGVDELLDDSGLSSHWWNPSVTELPEDRVWQLFESAARQQGCPEIGLLAGDRLTIPDLGPFGFQLQNSLTLYHCLNNYIQTVSRYSSHARFWLEQDGGALWFCREGIGRISHGREQVEQFTVQLMIRIVQLAMGQDWMPSRLRIQADTDLAFRQSPLLDATEIDCACPATGIQIPEFPGFRRIASDKNDPELIVRIRDKFIRGPNAYRMSIDDIGSELNISRRTLQRKLASLGADWSRLVEQCRFHQATQQLTEADVPLIELAQQLGYTDQANFGRAFRKWTGISPASFRRCASADK